MSADLQWLLVRNNNAFIVKRDGLCLSKEKGNLMNIHSFKFSGLVNPSAVDVSLNDKTIVLSTKRPKKCNKPSKTFTSCNLTTHKSNGKFVNADTIERATSASAYRADLTRFALARYAALNSSLSTKTKGVKKERKRRGKK